MYEGPDIGRAWFVAVAGLVINLISAGIYRAQGLLFVAFMSTFGRDRQKATMPFSVRMAVRNLVAPIVGILGQKYGAPVVIITGGILGTLSSAVCNFATDLVWITILWGVLNGLAMALITVLPQVVISQYFIKYRTTATGLCFSGGCMGSFVFPAILEYLLDIYGLHGTFFILAGMIMHVIPAAMLMKKPPWWKEDQQINYSAKERKICALDTNMEDCKVNNCNNYMKNVVGELCEYDVVKSIQENCNEQRCPGESDNRILPKRRSFSCNELTYVENNLQSVTMGHGVSTGGLNYKSINSNSEHIFDIDLDYIKQNDDLLFQMLSMEIPNMDYSYREILLDDEQNHFSCLNKNNMMHEIGSIYHNIERSLVFDPISSTKCNPNRLHIKRTSLNGAVTMSKKSEGLKATRSYFRMYKEIGLHRLVKTHSTPNISDIYNELARKCYVLSKLKHLFNCSDKIIISHMCQYDPKNVLKLLFHIRTLYKVYIDLEVTDHCECYETCETGRLCETLKRVEDSCFKMDAENKICNEEQNSFNFHIKTALKLHTEAIFLLIVCTRTAFFLSFTPVVTTVVDFAMDRGLQEEDGKYIIGVLSFGDLIGRIGLGWITDRGYVTLPRYMLLALCFLSLCTISIPLMHSRWTIFAAISLFGMIQGSLFVRHPVLVAKYLRPQQHSIAMGCMEFSSGVMCLILPLYIGYFRDTLGTYDPIYYINGIILFLSGIAWLFEPRMLKNDKESKELS